MPIVRDSEHEEDRTLETPAVKYPVCIAYYKDIPIAWLHSDSHVEQIHPSEVDKLSPEQKEKLLKIAKESI